MFVDIAKIKITAGDGGNGAVAFRREKYVAAGGPDGGDGGRGGNVVFKVNDNLSTLADFRYKRKYKAPNGAPGQSGHKSGKKGEDLIIEVPRGTIIREQTTGKVMADMSDDDEFIAAKGGRGGWGNSHFKTPTRQTPRFAKPGTPGESWDVSLELKLLADVGLLGFPNVGKSTLISVVSEAKPIIADYHFTTLTPVLGVVSMGEGNSFVMADIPGLIEGASDGVGLGHEFLRHVERCRLLVHIIDAAGSEGRDPIEDFNKINEELVKFNPDMADLPQIVVGNKVDLATDEQLEKIMALHGSDVEKYKGEAATLKTEAAEKKKAFDLLSGEFEKLKESNAGAADYKKKFEDLQRDIAEKEKAAAAAYLHLTGVKPTAKELAAIRTDDVRIALLRAALGSVADRAIIPMYDWLGLGAEAHLNTPGKLGGNWAWRAADGFAAKALAKTIHDECSIYCRV